MPKTSIPILPGERLSFWSSTLVDAAMVSPQVAAGLKSDCEC